MERSRGLEVDARRVGSPWRGRSCWMAGFVTCGLGAACVSGSATRGAPLYPATGAALPLDQVATLTGHVAEVDGRDVTALMPPYELMPGCHVVRTPERWNAVGTNMSMAAQTGMLPFALPMRAGHAYNVEAVTQMQTTLTSSLEIHAVETDATGQQTGVFKVTSDTAALDACGKQGAAAGATPPGT